MPWIDPKTDWTSEDYYNYGDLDRVENNTEAVADLIGSYWNRPMLESIVKSRDITTIEFADSLNRIERNVEAVKNSFYQPPRWLGTKTYWYAGDKFSFEEANRLETNLLLLFKLVQGTINNFKYCGTLSCGEGGI